MPKTKTKMNITEVDINGKPIDWSKTKLPDDLARKCLEIIHRGRNIQK